MIFMTFFFFHLPIISDDFHFYLIFFLPWTIQHHACNDGIRANSLLIYCNLYIIQDAEITFVGEFQVQKKNVSHSFDKLKKKKNLHFWKSFQKIFIIRLKICQMCPIILNTNHLHLNQRIHYGNIWNWGWLVKCYELYMRIPQMQFNTQQICKHIVADMWFTILMDSY